VSAYTERPWLALYGDGIPADITAEYGTMLEMFQASVARAPDAEAIRYFDGVLTMADVDAASDAVAAGFWSNTGSALATGWLSTCGTIPRS
jgi:long-chain acyl-CoA synthetase